MGVDAYCGNNNEVRLGDRCVASIGGEVGWSVLSNLHAKKDVRHLPLRLELVMQLRPVEYKLRSGNGRIDMGFLAEDIKALLGDGYNVLDIGRKYTVNEDAFKVVQARLFSDPDSYLRFLRFG